ncbi:MAG: hypothetical protein IJ759_05790 [Bacteroidales bacterium]|nr:hypothetical protein [Bacteroidales bacterium]
MKKVFLTLAFLVLAISANAQTKSDIEASYERAMKLQRLMNDAPKGCGVSAVDKYLQSVNAAAILAIENSTKLSDFYYREIGETKDGVTDVTIKKPSVDEVVSLGVTITGETAAIKTAKESLEEATKETKDLAEKVKTEKNPVKKGKAAKQSKDAAAIMAFSSDALAIITEESVAQGKAIQELIETVKSRKNL